MSEPEGKITTVTRRFAKYVFLDVVGFSVERSAEAQAHIISELNSLVTLCLEPYDRTLLPTGDGVCIALHTQDFDVHIRLALNLLERLERYNQETRDAMRRFQIRVGINQNTDILFDDINGQRNLAGAGINDASRIMDFAEGNQVFVSQVVYDELRPSEQYMGKFRDYHKRVKHNVPVTAYQFIAEGYIGLNTDVPAEFREKEKKDEKLTKLEAYYFAYALKMKPEIVRILNKSGGSAPAIRVFLYLSALDSRARAEATPMDPYRDTYHQPPIHEAVRLYSEAEGNVAAFALGIMIREVVLKNRYDYFESYNLFDLTSNGEKKLKADWPEIHKEICEGT